MDWRELSQAVIGAGAPLLGGLLGGPAGKAAGTLIASALGCEEDPAAIKTALSDLPAVERLRALEIERRAELESLHLEAESMRLAEVQRTIRAESVSEDPVVRRWRPFWGYVSACTWGLQGVGVILVVGFSLGAEDRAAATEFLRAMFEGLASLTLQWSVALAVLGVGVVSRSRDKRVAAGQEGLAATLVRQLVSK